MINTIQILEAIQTALVGDATLTAIVPAARIGNHLPDDTAFPHIFYSMESENGGVKGQTSLLVNLTLDVWTDYRGERQIWEIHNAIVTLFDRQELTIASGTNTYNTYVSTGIDLEGDGRTRHGTIIFDLLFTE